MWIQLQVVVLTVALAIYSYELSVFARHVVPLSAAEPAILVKSAICEDTSENALSEIHWLLSIIQQDSFLKPRIVFILDPEIRPMFCKACVDDA